jgi:hypothetical protein
MFYKQKARETSGRNFMDANLKKPKARDVAVDMHNRSKITKVNSERRRRRRGGGPRSATKCKQATGSIPKKNQKNTKGKKLGVLVEKLRTWGAAAPSDAARVVPTVC